MIPVQAKEKLHETKKWREKWSPAFTYHSVGGEYLCRMTWKTETINLLAVAAKQVGAQNAELQKEILLDPLHETYFLCIHLAKVTRTSW